MAVPLEVGQRGVEPGNDIEVHKEFLIGTHFGEIVVIFFVHVREAHDVYRTRY